MMVLWALQILFLQTFYQMMKSSELHSVAKTIEQSVGTESLYDIINSLTVRSDMYIQVERGSGDDGSTPLFASTDPVPSSRTEMFARRYNTASLKAKLDEDKTSVTTTQIISPGSSEIMIYGSILGKDSVTSEPIYLFIFTPLTPVSSTVNILAKLLIIVTIISVISGMCMSFVISRRLAKPLYRITASAGELAEGRYDITFDGTGYAETEELAATLNYAAGELSKSDQLQKDLVANVSHDLKTPLTMVKSYAEMIRDISGDDPEKRNRHLQVIINEADRLNLLVNDLTSLSKMQAGVDTAHMTDVDLRAIASEVIESFSLHEEQDGFVFSLEAEGNTVVPADEKKIYQVFSNLIGNAVRYSGDTKEITVRIKETNDAVRCEVADRGQGISEEDLTSIWDRYYQSSSNRSRNTKGSGLGLSIVKQIFLLHDANYGVQSQENVGSTFWFELKKTKSETSQTQPKSRKRRSNRE